MSEPLVLYPDLAFRATPSELTRVEWVVVHTAAGADQATAEDIHQYHRSLGWLGAGYHWFLRIDGKIERMRAEKFTGAHALGLNDRSLGVCCAGHGDRSDFTFAQKKALGWLLRDIRARHRLGRERIIGHREIDKYAGAPPARKTCPGNKVDMQEIRELSDPPQPEAPEIPARVWSRTVGGGSWIYPTEVRSDRDWAFLTETHMRQGVPGQWRATTPLSQMPREP